MEEVSSEEVLEESRSYEQVENGVTSTSPTFWDMDDDNDGGPKTSELYGNYTWKIDDFSTINKRELRSNAFEVGGYKWYILIYPQGCDVNNHLSLFLCVANHDKLLPGWSHFAQFTIAVVNKDPKRTKYSDTLHRFWKKEHDWGWKKFMELSKVLDGFTDGNSLTIKAQVQVIRERADRPFRCLGCQYRRELIRVYLTNVEAICRRFVEERRSKLGNLIEDKARWSSFCTFWSGIDQNTKHLISREKSDAVLRAVVKNFFIEKEVSSTLVMDSLYSGLKCLEWMSKNKRSREKSTSTGELVVPMVLLEKDMFILVDDVLLLVKRAAIEPLPPKDDKGPQNRTKDGCSEEDLIKDSIEHDESRLTELGRRTIEIFALAHIFSKIEIAYQEAVSLKRQEELIREEEAEAASLAESEHKAKRGIDRKKKSKKKQGKQKRNGRKAKGGKGRDEKANLVVEDKLLEISDPHGIKDLTLEAECGYENPITVDDISDLSDSLDCVTEVLQADSDGRGSSPVCWDTESINSEVTILDSSQNGKGERRIPSSMDDSSSTCSTDSVPSVVRNGFSQTNQGTQKSPVRRNHLDETKDAEPDCVPQSFPEQTNSPDQPVVKKEEVTSSVDSGIPSKETTTGHSPPSSPPQNLVANNVSVGKRPMSAGPTRCTSKPDLGEVKEQKPIEKPSVVQHVPVIPSFETPLPLLERSVSAAGRLGSAPSYIPQSYPNAIMGVSAGFPQYYPPPDLRNPSFGMRGPPHSHNSLSSHSYIISGSETGQQTTQNAAAMLEFPHLDIINDLLDDENGNGSVSGFVNNGPYHNLNRQFSYPAYTRTWGGDMDTSSTPSYHDYVSSPPLTNQRHGFVGNQWRQIGEPHLTMMMGMRNNEPDVLSYGGIPDYNLPYSRFLSGNGLYRPSNGY
ncbi:TNF receptor-associated factor homolog 1a-like [Impatiens glandulifera]|uniref:TNF receptor-associated factor homolog 1a-like n=1 Tax=Impatiens glandulifera TaxID=253017 RepID=UPI001FB0A2D2|nr:TNF receptor-associated factor homolog 1a-like [Impatiens glandulifera]